MSSTFEINNDLEVKVARVCGRSLVIVDNFYKNPDEVRQLVLDNRHNPLAVGDPGHLPGTRLYLDTVRVRDKLYKIYQTLCSDKDLWGRRYNEDKFTSEFRKLRFSVNIINDRSLSIMNDIHHGSNMYGLVPHQDSYYLLGEPYINPQIQFGSVIYLNTPEECRGGTNVYTFRGEISIPQIPSNISTPTSVSNFIENNPDWKVAHTFEMVYNRMVLYQADILHGPVHEKGMFTDNERMNQILFM